MSKVFISYNRDDHAFVDRLTEDLAESGHEVWIDRKDISAGSGRRQSISQAIRSCRAFVLVLSRKSVAATNVIKELSIADTHRRYIVPLLIDDVEIPPEMEYQLADLQLIDFRTDVYERGLGRLLAALDRAEETFVPPPPARAVVEEARETVTVRKPISKKSRRRSTGETIVVSEKSRPSLQKPAPTGQGETNRMAIISFVSALLGYSFVPGFGLIVALLAGYAAKRQIHSSNGAEKGRGLAQAGILLGWIGVIIFTLALCYWIDAYQSMMDMPVY